MNISRYQRELSVAAAYAVLLIVLAIAAPRFYEGDKLLSILVASAPVLVAAVGMSLVILTRQIDISIGSQFSVLGIFAGWLVKEYNLPMPLACALTVAAGAGFGAMNGGLVAGLGLPSIVVTLATMVILREGLRWQSEGEFVKNLPASFQWFGLGQDAGQWLLVAISLVVLAVFAWGLRNLAAGRAVYATGSNPDAAFLAGVQPRRVVLASFVVLGALTGLAALLNSVRFVDVDPIAGNGLEMQVIAAVVVGGVAIAGGRGTLIGPAIGVALLATIGPALVFLGAQPYWEKAIQGAIILAAVALDAVGGRRSRHG
jgi:rhamnose transport system permease protein